MTDVRSQLLALRALHGAETPIGQRCSNLLEQTENYLKETDEDARKNLAVAIERQMAGLSKLCRGNYS